MSLEDIPKLLMKYTNTDGKSEKRVVPDKNHKKLRRYRKYYIPSEEHVKADNPISVQLAEKLGYILVDTYEVLMLP